jgi:predicted nuclease of predicted toxin-antitoxin system
MLPEIEIWLDNQFSSVLAKWMKVEWLIEVKSSFALKTKAWKDRDIFLLAKRKGNVILLTKEPTFQN